MHKETKENDLQDSEEEEEKKQAFHACAVTCSGASLWPAKILSHSCNTGQLDDQGTIGSPTAHANTVLTIFTVSTASVFLHLIPSFYIKLPLWRPALKYRRKITKL